LENWPVKKICLTFFFPKEKKYFNIIGKGLLEKRTKFLLLFCGLIIWINVGFYSVFISGLKNPFKILQN